MGTTELRPRARVALGRTLALVALALVALACRSGGGPPAPEAAQPAAVAVPRAPGRVVRAVLPLDREPQRTSQWCWAASTEMALRNLLGDAAPTVCGEDGIVAGTWRKISTKRLEDCLAVCDACGDPDDPALARCVNTGWPQLQPYGIAYSLTPYAEQKKETTALAWDVVKEQLAPGTDGRAAPVVFSWAWTGGGGHVAVASGFVEAPDVAGGVRLVLVQDPWPPCLGDTYLMPYEAWAGSPARGRVHWIDYWDLHVAGEDDADAASTDAQASIPASQPVDVTPEATAPALPALPALPPLGPDGTGPPAAPDEALALARRGLSIVQQVATDDRTRQQLGFPTAEALASATLAPPVWEVRVRLDDLAAHGGDPDPTSILSGVGWTFPVVAPGSAAPALSSVCVEHDGSSWQLEEVGGQSAIGRILETIRAAASQTPPWTPADSFHVSVPALRKHYLAHVAADGTLWLIKIPSRPGTEVGEARKASDVLAELAPEAATHDGQPG